MAAVLKNLGVERTFLVVLPRPDGELWRCTRNIRGASMLPVSDLNAYEVLKAREIVFTREAFDMLAATPQPSTSAASGLGTEGE
jgi:large subunit ribosomal protein L4